MITKLLRVKNLSLKKKNSFLSPIIIINHNANILNLTKNNVPSRFCGYE